MRRDAAQQRLRAVQRQEKEARKALKQKKSGAGIDRHTDDEGEGKSEGKSPIEGGVDEDKSIAEAKGRSIHEAKGKSAVEAGEKKRRLNSDDDDDEDGSDLHNPALLFPRDRKHYPKPPKAIKPAPAAADSEEDDDDDDDDEEEEEEEEDEEEEDDEDADE